MDLLDKIALVIFASFCLLLAEVLPMSVHVEEYKVHSVVLSYNQHDVVLINEEGQQVLKEDFNQEIYPDNNLIVVTLEGFISGIDYYNYYYIYE